MERLVQEANDLLNPNKNLCVNDVTVTLDCGFQWIPYNYQSTDGNTYYWIEDQLSGECGISRKHEGVWFNITG